jgi:hypothetical protein
MEGNTDASGQSKESNGEHRSDYEPYDECPNCREQDSLKETGEISGKLTIYDDGGIGHKDEQFGSSLVLECDNCKTTLISRARLADGLLVPDLTKDVLETLYEFMRDDPALDSAPAEVLEAMEVLADGLGYDYNWTRTPTDEKVQTLSELRDNPLFGLVSIDPDYEEGVILYESGASRVGGEPAIEIPHEDPFLVDESDVPGGTTPAKTFGELLAEYDCTAKQRSGYTYIVVESDRI